MLMPLLQDQSPWIPDLTQQSAFHLTVLFATLPALIGCMA